MKIALFKSTRFDYVTPWDKVPVGEDFVQISGWVQVEFPPLTEAEQRVSEELQALAQRQKTFEEDFRRQRKALEEEREALLKTGT
jgi:hypothetical protein